MQALQLATNNSAADSAKTVITGRKIRLFLENFDAKDIQESTLQRAAKNGSARAQHQLARWYLVQNLSDLIDLADFYLSVSDSQEKSPEAIALLRSAAEKGNAGDIQYWWWKIISVVLFNVSYG